MNKHLQLLFKTKYFVHEINRESDDTTKMRYIPADAFMAEIRGEVEELVAENDDINKIFKLQRIRSEQADELWRVATGNHDMIPDMGELLEWLMERKVEGGENQFNHIMWGRAMKYNEHVKEITKLRLALAFYAGGNHIERNAIILEDNGKIATEAMGGEAVQSVKVD